MRSQPSPESSDSEPATSLIRRLPWIRLGAEFLVIFVGVTLSLIADDWRQSRRDLESERRALEELLVDLGADAESLEAVKSTMARHDSAAMWLYQRIGRSGLALDSLNLHLGQIHGLGLFLAQRASYVALMSTGQLGLIEDEALRKAIVRYYEDLQPEVEGFYEVYLDAWYDWRRLLGPDYVWVYEEGVETFERGRSVGVLARDWVEISSDPVFGYLLRETGVLASVTSGRTAAALEQHACLVEAIQERLGRQGGGVQEGCDGT